MPREALEQKVFMLCWKHWQDEPDPNKSPEALQKELNAAVFAAAEVANLYAIVNTVTESGFVDVSINDRSR